MAKESGTGEAPLRETEDMSIHAIREWPVLLIDRRKELQSLQTGTPAEGTVQETLDAASSISAQSS